MQGMPSDCMHTPLGVLWFEGNRNENLHQGW
jgi:hypothetical protein